MKKSTTRLTESEQQVLDLLWDREESLTSSEIVSFCEGRTWKESYIHILINSLLKKKMIEVDGFKKTTKNYARTFKPSMTREEYSIYQIKQNQRISSKSLSHLFSAMLEEETDSSVLDDLSKMLEERKQQLNKK
ncbi:MAG: BlaI/MecI/CopY family transcriptional regulator [Eubacterium sp.]|jgi:predicted transcriptional regulator|nr:BlaI/MecI/CopY family transcriptional regulator [Eubacterium sp.]